MISYLPRGSSKGLVQLSFQQLFQLLAQSCLRSAEVVASNLLSADDMFSGLFG